jgi:large subunit ribosomal protein L17
MRHRKRKVKLGRSMTHRRAMIHNMTASLIQHERIRTTLQKAKGIRSTVDHVITLAKREDLHARRQVLQIIPDKKLVHKLFTTLASRYSDRPGGFTRIYRLDYRKGDAAEMAVIELVDAEFAEAE